jgi:hypothetical protein
MSTRMTSRTVLTKGISPVVCLLPRRKDRNSQKHAHLIDSNSNLEKRVAAMMSTLTTKVVGDDESVPMAPASQSN